MGMKRHEETLGTFKLLGSLAKEMEVLLEKAERRSDLDAEARALLEEVRQELGALRREALDLQGKAYFLYAKAQRAVEGVLTAKELRELYF